MNHFETRAWVLYTVCMMLHYVVSCLLSYKLIQFNESTYLLWSTKLLVFSVSWFGHLQKNCDYSLNTTFGEKVSALRPVCFDVLCCHPCLTVHVPWDSWFAYRYTGCTVVWRFLAWEQEWDPTGAFRGSALLEQMYKLFIYLPSVGALLKWFCWRSIHFLLCPEGGAFLQFCTLERMLSVLCTDRGIL